MRYRLRTLLIVLAVAPPLIWFGWTKYEAWRAERAARALYEELERQAEADQVVTRITINEDEDLLIELSPPDENRSPLPGQ
jgi:hypothetical protein